MTHPVPVLCDRCGATGHAGDAAFSALGDLLDFAPVPRKIERADGWTADVQRNFIAALAYTGSARRAAAAVGKAQFGADQLRRAKGNESFLAAWDKALAFFKEKSQGRLAAGLGLVHREDAAWQPATGPFSRAQTRALPPPPAEPTEEELNQQDKLKLDLLRILVKKYLAKLEQERKARLAGRIAEADFYCRQVTMLEVSLDMLSGDGMAILRQYRCEGRDLLTIAETEFSKLMDNARRAHWNDMGEPERPEYPPRHLLVHHDGFSTEPLEHTEGGIALSREEQRRRFEEQHTKDAAVQVAWEAKARADAEAWRARVEAEGTADEIPAP